MPIEVGAVVEGFRIEGVLGRGATSVVYEVTQLTLGRRVALKLFRVDLTNDPGFVARFQHATRLRASFHHPHIVAVYDARTSAYGPFVAMQLVRGTSLAALLREHGLDATHALELLRPAAEALDAAHAAGLVHGEVRLGNVLVDTRGRPFLDEFGMREGASADDDRAAFATMLLECLADHPLVPPDAVRAASRTSSATALVDTTAAALGGGARARRSRRRLLWVASSLIAAVAIVTAGMVAGGGAFRTFETQAAPALNSGTLALGSDLAPGTFRTIGCDGQPPTPNSPACTVLQTSLSGALLVVPDDGVISSWAVRGARGRMRLQVIRPLQGGRYVRVVASQIVEISDERVYAFPVDLEVRPGDVAGVAISPGAAIGVRDGRPAVTARWIGPLLVDARSPSHGEGTLFDQEILVRADFLPGARRRLPPQLSGADAARASVGVELAARVIELPDGVAVRVSLVSLPEGIALDLFRGSVRVSRLDVPDADGAGTLIAFERGEFADAQRAGVPVGDLSFVWMNPGSTIPLEHRYALTGEAIEFVD